MKLREIDGGIAFDMMPVSEEAAIRMHLVNKFTIEVRRITQTQALVTEIIEFPDPLGSLFDIIPAPSNKEYRSKNEITIDEVLGLDEGSCHML